MSIVSGYNPEALTCQIIIANEKEEIEFEYIMKNFSPGGIRDFNFEGLHMHLGVNDDPGLARIVIDDRAKLLIDSNGESKILEGWSIQLKFAKIGEPMKRWFWGRIQTSEVIIPETDIIKIGIIAHQWGLRGVKRVSILEHNQIRADDGLTGDVTDNNSKISEIAKRLVTTKDGFIIRGLPLETQTLIPNLEAYLTFERDILDKRKSNNGTLVHDEENADTGFNAENQTFATGSVYVGKLIGLPDGAEISNVAVDVITALGDVRVKVYKDNAGEPGALLGESGTITVPGTGIQDFALTTVAKVPSDGIVWIGFENDNAGLDLAVTTGEPSGTSKSVTHTYGDGPDPFGTPTNQTFGIWLRIKFNDVLKNSRFVDAIVGKGLTFNGKFYVDLDNESNFDILNTKSFAIPIWEKTSDVANTMYLIDKDDGSTGYRLWFSGVETGIRFRVTTSSGITEIRNNTTNLRDGNLHSIQIIFSQNGTFDAGRFSMIIDGVLEADTDLSDTAGSTSAANARALRLGADDAAGNKFDGVLDEYRFYQDILLETNQIEAIYRMPYRTTDVQDLDIKLFGMKSRLYTWQFILTRLAGMGAALFGMDGDRKFYLREPESKDSGFLFSNDETLLAGHPNQTTTGRLRGSLQSKRSIAKGGHNILHAVGTASDTLDINDTVEDAAFDLSTEFLAISIKPTVANIRAIALRFRRKGTIPDNLSVRIVGSTASGPDTKDLRSNIICFAEILNELSDTDFSWAVLDIPRNFTEPNEELFIILNKFGNASNTIEVAYDSAGAEANYEDDNAAFSSPSAQSNRTYAKRTYPTRSVNLILMNLSSIRKHGPNEKTLEMRDLPSTETQQQVLLAIAPVLGRKRRTFENVRVSPPSDPLFPGQLITLNDKQTGFSKRVVLIGLDLDINGFDKETAAGASYLDLQVEVFS